MAITPLEWGSRYMTASTRPSQQRRVFSQSLRIVRYLTLQEGQRIGTGKSQNSQMRQMAG
jgi:hypothetical protein